MADNVYSMNQSPDRAMRIVNQSFHSSPSNESKVNEIYKLTQDTLRRTHKIAPNASLHRAGSSYTVPVNVMCVRLDMNWMIWPFAINKMP